MSTTSMPAVALMDVRIALDAETLGDAEEWVRDLMNYTRVGSCAVIHAEVNGSAEWAPRQWYVEAKRDV